jgi:hypothetical protein
MTSVFRVKLSETVDGDSTPPFQELLKQKPSFTRKGSPTLGTASPTAARKGCAACIMAEGRQDGAGISLAY